MIHVVAHSPCTDGFAAAYAVWKYAQICGLEVRFYPYSHGSPWPEIPCGNFDDVFFVDVAPPEEEILSFLEHDVNVTVFDHHLSAVSKLGPVYETLVASYPRFDYVFDMTQSGAVLTWQELHPLEDIPTILRYVQDQDLWEWKLEDSKAINAYLGEFPLEMTEQNFKVFDSLVEEYDDEDFGLAADVRTEVLDIGATVLETKMHMVEKIAETAFLSDFVVSLGEEHYIVPVVNCPWFFASDVCNRLLELHPRAPFVGSFTVGEFGKEQWSLRSTDDRLDVSVIATKLGGGGHRNASGFTIYEKAYANL